MTREAMGAILSEGTPRREGSSLGMLCLVGWAGEIKGKQYLLVSCTFSAEFELLFQAAPFIAEGVVIHFVLLERIHN